MYALPTSDLFLGIWLLRIWADNMGFPEWSLQHMATEHEIDMKII